MTELRVAQLATTPIRPMGLSRDDTGPDRYDLDTVTNNDGSDADIPDLANLPSANQLLSKLTTACRAQDYLQHMQHHTGYHRSNSCPPTGSQTRPNTLT